MDVMILWSSKASAFLRWKGADEFAESAPALIPEREQPIHVISRNRSRIGEKLPNLALTYYCPGCEPMTTKDEGKLAFSDDCVRFLEYEN